MPSTRNWKGGIVIRGCAISKTLPLVQSCSGCCPKILFACLKAFRINLKLAKGNDKTHLWLKQLSLLIFRRAWIYKTKRFQWPLKGMLFGQQPV